MTEAMRLFSPFPNDDVQIIARSPNFRQAVALADRFALTPLPILLIGATGTGKELFARRIHAVSGRRGPLVPVNCAALPRDMVESMLFGHSRGAFTGAVKEHVGFIEAADRGTLYLDELPSLPLEAQGKLLRVLESKDVYRLGETKPRRADFRLVTSGQEDLGARVRDGLFRLDLFHRVAGVRVDLAPLRERPEDVIPLAELFATSQGWVLAPGATRVLTEHDWPGNARELRAAVERAGFMSGSKDLGATALAEAIGLGTPLVESSAGGVDKCEKARAEDRAQLLSLCRSHGGDARGVAAVLGLSLSTLYRRLASAGISLRPFRNSHLFSENSQGR